MATDLSSLYQTDQAIGRLPASVLARARERVKHVAAMLGLTMLGTSALAASSHWFDALAFARPYSVHGDFVSAALWLALLGAAVIRTVPDATVVRASQWVFLASCLSLSVTTSAAYQASHGHIPLLTLVVPLIVFFPLMVPTRPRVTLRVLLGAALTVPVGLALAGVASSPWDYLAVLLYPLPAVFLGLVGSRMLYSVRREIDEARRRGSYQLEARLGHGGMGEVWRAHHELLARPAAVKVVRPEVLAAAREPEALMARFEREAKLTASLSSPHAVELYDYGRAEDGSLYFVMELLEGMDLHAMVVEHGALSPSRAIHFLLQASHALAEAHDRGLVHRDVKPANLFVGRSGLEEDFLKVLDFGLAKLVAVDGDQAGGLTLDKDLIGTPAFMPPEMILSDAEIDGRADVYALGCVAYWLLTGTPVFEEQSVPRLIYAHADKEPVPPSLRTFLPIPEDLEAVVLHCLAKDPAERPPSMLALREDLLACADAGRWGQTEARAWWSTHREAGQAQARGGASA